MYPFIKASPGGCNTERGIKTHANTLQFQWTPNECVYKKMKNEQVRGVDVTPDASHTQLFQLGPSFKSLCVPIFSFFLKPTTVQINSVKPIFNFFLYGPGTLIDGVIKRQTRLEPCGHPSRKCGFGL